MKTKRENGEDRRELQENKLMLIEKLKNGVKRGVAMSTT